MHNFDPIIRSPIESQIIKEITKAWDEWNLIGSWATSTDVLSSFGSTGNAQYKREVQMASVDGETSFNPENDDECLVEFAKCLKEVCKIKKEIQESENTDKIN